MDPKDALLAQYQDEIKKLKERLKAQGKGGEPMAIGENDLESANKLKEMEENNLKLREREQRMRKNLKQKEDLVE